MPGCSPARQMRLEVLRRQIARTGNFPARLEEGVPLGVTVDGCLTGGLVRGALHEITAADHRSIPAALGFLLALCSPVYRGSMEPKARQRGHMLWPLAKQGHAFGMPYAPGLRFFGLDPARILFV